MTHPYGPKAQAIYDRVHARMLSAGRHPDAAHAFAKNACRVCHQMESGGNWRDQIAEIDTE
jgi:cytochrome c551/c552